MLLRYVLTLLFVGALATSCERNEYNDEGSRTGGINENVEEAGEDVGEGIEDAGDEVEDAAD